MIKDPKRGPLRTFCNSGYVLHPHRPIRQPLVCLATESWLRAAEETLYVLFMFIHLNLNHDTLFSGYCSGLFLKSFLNLINYGAAPDI